MKQNNLFKTALLLLLAVAGTTTAWADGTISIPQNLGSYILIGNASTNPKTTATGITLTGCQVDGSAESSYTVGSTSGSTVRMEFALTAEAGNYLFSFKSGAQDASIISLSLTNSSSEVVWSKASESIEDTDSWSLTKSHNFVIGNLAAGNYTMTITGVTKTGSYYGNFGNFSFHKSSQYADNWNNTTDININDFYFDGANQNGNYITNIDANDYVEFYTYAPHTACYNLYCGIGYSTAGTDQFTITITDVATSTVEVNGVNYTVNSTHSYPLTSMIDGGWKKIRLAFPIQPASPSCRVEHIKFNPFENLPLMGAGGVAYLDLSKGTFGRTGTAKVNHDPVYESGNQNIGYNGDGGYAEFYVSNTNEAAYYDFHIGTKRYQNDATFTLTITDVATSTIEVNQSGLAVPSGSGYADHTYRLSNLITPGLKLIRIETASSSSDYAFNYNHVTFYKRSLNEGYNYTPVAATDVDVVLTRSITADKWSTICLPFNISATDLGTALGTTVTLAGITGYDSGTRVISTEALTSITAKVPCFIKTSSDVSAEASISDVTIVEGTPEKVIDGTFKLVGTYSAMDIPSGCYFVSNNNLYKSTGNSHIKPFRAYFENVPAGARIMFWDDEDVTAVTDVRRDVNGVKGEYFDLQGRKVANPTKGLYIVNGKKVIIR